MIKHPKHCCSMHDRQQLYHLCSSLWENFSYKNSLLVISEILRPFVNTMTPKENYFLCNWDNLAQPIQMKLSKKLKRLPQFFTTFLKSTFNLEHSKKKVQQLTSFQNFELRNTCFCKCLKSHASVHPRTVNTSKHTKHIRNMHDTSFVTLAHHFRKISVRKSLSQ